MIYWRGLSISIALSFVLATGTKLILNQSTNSMRESVVTQSCRMVSVSEQVGSLHDVYDQIFSLLRVYDQDPRSSVTVFDGQIDYGPRMKDSDDRQTIACAVAGRPDLAIQFHFPRLVVLDFRLFILSVIAFSVLLSGWFLQQLLFQKAILVAHDEFSKSLEDIFSLESQKTKNGLLRRFLSRIFLANNVVIKRVQSDLLEQKRKLEQASVLQNEYTHLSERFVVNEEKSNLVRETIQRIRHDLRSPTAYLRNHGTKLIEQNASSANIYNLSLNIIDGGLRELDQHLNVQVLGGLATTLDVAECLIHDSIEVKKGLWGNTKKVSVTFQYDKFQLSPIEVVPQHFIRVIDNLLENAFEAIPVCGKIAVICRRKNEGVEIVISDNGKGIPESFLAEIGEAKITLGKSHGNGIGVRASKSWVESWGGKLQVASGEGRGTTVTVFLPLANIKAPLIGAIPRQNNCRGIVIVDDDCSFAEALANTVKIPATILSSITAYGEWLDNIEDPAEYVHVFDLHLNPGSGLDLVEMTPWPGKTILYTEDYMQPTLVLRAGELGVPIFPKCLVYSRA